VLKTVIIDSRIGMKFVCDMLGTDNVCTPSLLIPLAVPRSKELPKSI
jgi:hypothetical protein